MDEIAVEPEEIPGQSVDEPDLPDLRLLPGGQRDRRGDTSDQLDDLILGRVWHEPYPHCSTMEWWPDAACRGEITLDGRLLSQVEVADLFHPQRTDSPVVVRTAKAVCRKCPVQMECLLYALDANETIGIWGGTGGKERRQMQRRRKIAKLRVISVDGVATKPGESIVVG